MEAIRISFDGSDTEGAWLGDSESSFSTTSGRTSDGVSVVVFDSIAQAYDHAAVASPSTIGAMTDSPTATDTPVDPPSEKAERPKRRWLRRTLWTLLALLVAAVIFATAFARYSVHRAFPDTEGTFEVPGLIGQVEVLRDSLGVPHIYADNEHDLFVAQGYVHAQDRFYQMDFWRHISSGRLAEMFGESQVDTDAFLRAMDWIGLAEKQYADESDHNRGLLDAYADGVNAYLATQSPADLSFEYSILELLNHSYEPEPWTGPQSLAWGKAMAWDLGGNLGSEIERAMLLAVLPPERVNQLFPPYPGDRHPYIAAAAGTGGSANDTGFIVPEQALSGLSQANVTVEALNDLLLGGNEPSIGSNSWVVDGSISPTGAPMLADDPHLGAQMPSIWYQVGLHCRTVSDACPIDVAGFSFAGVPGVIIGHNADIAWGFTNTGPDVQDLYIEKINPDNPNQYEVDGAWVDMDVKTDTILVAGADPVVVEVRSTIHGPIISDLYEPLDDFDTAGVTKPDPYAIALRWTALDELPSLFSPIYGMNTASDWDDFRAAARTFDVPAQNLLYADTAGNIGYQMPGAVPIRSAGDGTLPVPGWTGDHEWTGFIPFDELPHMYNPESGWIVTANNAVISEEYPYLITKNWDAGYRARRIVDLLTSNPGLDVNGFGTLQFDSYDLNAEHVLAYLENALVVTPGFEIDDQEQDAINHLFRWDFQNFAGSTGAAIWNATWRNLLAETFDGELPEDHLPEGNSRWFEVVRGLLDIPDDPFWDDPSTTAVENRDVILVRSFEAAVVELTDTLGSTVSDWRWGDIHTMTFRNQSLGDTGIGLIDDRFNRGPYPASGSEGIVNAVGWTSTEGYEVDWLPSMRMVVDLSDLRNSTAIHTTGQSGHIDHPHYDDMIEAWLAGETFAMLWDRADVEVDTEARMLLVPAG